MLNVGDKQVIVNSHELGIYHRVLAVYETQDERVWLGLPEGLYEFRDDQLLPPSYTHPAFQVRVDDLTALSDGTLAIATKGAGLLLWRDSSVQQVKVAEGLISNAPENLHVDSSGRLWVGSLQGLSRLTFVEDSFRIEDFTTWHGLPSNEINQVRSRGEEVWIATTRGLLRWQEPVKNRSTTPPHLTEWRINGQVQNLQKTELPYQANNQRFTYLTLNYNQAGQIPYRYRLNTPTWNYTQDRQTNFSQLAPGSYRFEVQSQNEDGLWSESLVHAFVIQAPWWQRWWFYTLLGIVVIGLAIGFYRYQIGILRQKVTFQEQLASLERKALQAQMNPHFIFNCLNSIQKLILEQDSDQTVRYLSRFAQLVRGTLNASVQGEVCLEEEVDLLTAYLELEKLRFKEAFTFTIEVDPQLDTFDNSFPPMLLQPFVENAVLHGMANRESGGRIQVQFTPATGTGLVATITDNSPGIHAHSKLRPDHKSVGMSLTQRRLELLEGNTQQRVAIREITQANGTVVGTEVRVELG